MEYVYLRFYNKPCVWGYTGALTINPVLLSTKDAAISKSYKYSGQLPLMDNTMKRSLLCGTIAKPRRNTLIHHAGGRKVRAAVRGVPKCSILVWFTVRLLYSV